MPALSKKSLSLFLRNKCERQFVFSLYDDKEREKYDLPPRQKTRAGLGIVGQIGYEWQDLKIKELGNVFGTEFVLVNPMLIGKQPAPLDLLSVLPTAKPYQFIVEAKYDPDTPIFRDEIGFNSVVDYFGNCIDVKKLQPDIIQVLPPTYKGPETTEGRNPYKLAVEPNGNIHDLDDNDNRLKLRVIDIKLASEPGAHYFAEVVYYSLTLAGWLIENHLDNKYVVVAAPAVWPGSHDASNLSLKSSEWKKTSFIPNSNDVAIALEGDIEVAAFDVFAQRLRHFLVEEFPIIIKKEWHELNWHVDRRCKGCEYLGYPWKDEKGNLDQDPRHCLPTAKDIDDLSQVFELSRGASQELRSKKITNVATLSSTTSASPIFNEHQGLRSKRTTYPFRASSLKNNSTSIIPDSGGDALMPRWPDLHIYTFLDYDINTAITAAFAIRAFWLEPVPYGSSSTDRGKKKWPEKQDDDQIFLVDKPSIDREREEFIKFLRQLKRITSDVITQDMSDFLVGRRTKKTEHSTYQIYFWDEGQRKHLIRLIGRHLPYLLADPQIKDTAWLFPPPELMPKAEDATRQSPITIVANVVFNTVAVPIPHHYRLMDIVETLKPENSPAPSIHPLYQEPMSDLIPAERIHEWWNRIGKWDEKQDLIKETSRKKIYALYLIVSKLEKELREVLFLQSAPHIVPRNQNNKGLAAQSRLWLEFSRLNVAIQGLDIQTIRAMPAHEREAHLKSARLTKRLSGQELEDALTKLNQFAGKPLSKSSDLFVYEIAPGSVEVNVKPGDFLYALSPFIIFGFLDQSPYPYIKDTTLKDSFASTFEQAGFTTVTIEAIDRSNRLIALKAGYQNCIPQLEKETKLDFSRDVILDPIHKDFFTKKLEANLQSIGNPPTASVDQKVITAMGLPSSTASGNSPITPAAEVLWEAGKICAEKMKRDISKIKITLHNHLTQNNNASLDLSQWIAWEQALTQKISLIWGPPGTGKSRTLRAIIQGAVLSACETNQQFRILITGSTYNAVDNVLLDLEEDLRNLFTSIPRPYKICRIQSKWHVVEPDLATKHPDIKNLVLNTAHPSDEIKELRTELENPSNILIVGCLPQQLYNLSVAGMQKPKPKEINRNWFDFVVLDEASQMDVALSTLVFTKLAPNYACVLAGDDLQLPPIQPADSPKDLGNLVGSCYNYFRHYHAITPISLDVNYRSNKTIVEFTRMAGYSSQLKSFSPDLNICYLSDFSDTKPKDWPDSLFWTKDWLKFLDTKYSTLTFVYEDQLSSQVNDFEADSIAALIWHLNHNLGNKLINQTAPSGEIDMVLPTETYSPKEFWGKAVGVVTPHKAQMSKIVYRLQEVFGTHSPEIIRSAVDTVERFQGQERDIIFASFGLGDPDIIGNEDEFLFSLNRFNVLTSRARAKIIVFAPRSLLDHLSDDIDTLYESRLIKQFAESYCSNVIQADLGFQKNGKLIMRSGLLKRK